MTHAVQLRTENQQGAGDNVVVLQQKVCLLSLLQYEMKWCHMRRDVTEICPSLIAPMAPYRQARVCEVSTAP